MLLEKMRKYADLRGDKRKFFGAIAGVVMDDDIWKSNTILCNIGLTKMTNKQEGT